MARRTPAQYDWAKALFNDRRLSKHFTSPRRSKIKTVTLHHMTILAPGDGSGSTVALEGCYRTWQTRQASANYGVSGNQVWQYVSDGDAAWANASSSNHETLSIEHANSTAGPSWKVSGKTMETGARLVATLHRLYGLGRPSRKTVKMHRDYYATACPGPYMVDHLGEYIAAAARFYDQGADASPSKPTPAPKPRLIKTKVATWNIPGADKIPNPSARAKRAGHIIRTVAPGILGVQEAVGISNGKPSVFAGVLAAELYGWTMIAPTTQFNENYLIIRDSEFRLVRQLPDIIVRAKVGKRNVPGRHVTIAIVEHNASGRELLVANTHLVNDDPGGVNMQSRIVAGKVLEAAGGRPVAIVGDLNCTRTDGTKRTDFTPIGFTERGYVDTRLAAAAVSKAAFDTYARYDRTAPTEDQGWRIDRIHVKGGKDAPAEVRGHFHHLDVDKAGKFHRPRPSDHSLVYASIRLP